MFHQKTSQNMPPSSYMDPFNERANDSFFGQLPKHFDTSSSIAQYNSFYGGIAGQKGAWESALPSKKKSKSSKDRSKQKQKNKLTPSPSKEYDEESFRGSSYTPKQLKELPVKTANSKWQAISHDAGDDTSGTEELSWDSHENGSTKGRSKSSRRQIEDRIKAQESRRETLKKTGRKKGRSSDYDSQDGAEIDLPPAFQMMAKLDKKKGRHRGQSIAADDKTLLSQAKKSKDNEIPQETAKCSERARSRDRRKDRDHPTSKRERSVSLSRLKSKKEELRARKRDEKSSQQDEKLSNSLPAMGYKGRLKERNDDAGKQRHHDSPRRRSGSVGRLHKESTKYRRDKDSNDVKEGQMELASPSAASRRSRRETKQLEQPKRSNSVGALQKKTRERRGRDRASTSAGPSEERPKRSNSVGRLHKKTKHRQSGDSIDIAPVPKTASENKPRRSNSVGALHKKSRSIRESDDPCSNASKGRLQSRRTRTNNHDQAIHHAPTTLSSSMTPNTKARKKVASKPAASSMDGIFGSHEVTQPKQVKSTSVAPINAVHGNKSALAAWKVREASKEESTPVRIRSKASIAAAYEEAVGISPRRPSREDFLQVPSMFTSPPLVAKNKLKVKSSSPTRKSTKTPNHQMGKDNRESPLPPAFRGVSCRPQRRNS